MKMALVSQDLIGQRARTLDDCVIMSSFAKNYDIVIMN